MFESFKKKHRLAKLDKRFWSDMQEAYSIADEGKVVPVRAVYWLVDGSAKERTWECKGYWFSCFDRNYYVTSREEAEDLVDRYKLPKDKDIQFDDNTASPYSAILNYDIWIDE